MTSEVNSIRNGGVGLYTILQGMNKAVMQQAVIMVLNAQLMEKLTFLMSRTSTQLKAVTTKLLKITTEKLSFAKMNAIVTALALLGGLTFVDLSGAENPTGYLSKFHRSLAGIGRQAFIMSGAVGGATAAFYAIKKGKLSSEVLELNGGTDTLQAVERYQENTWYSNSQTMQALTKSEKAMIQDDYRSKVR